MMTQTRTPSATRRIDWTERFAVAASFACLVHCLVLPIAIAMLPALSNALSLPEGFHLGVLLFALPTSCVALVAGRRRHGTSGPMAAGIAGLTLLAIGALAFGTTRWEAPVTVAGSIVLAGAHLVNWRRRHALR